MVAAVIGTVLLAVVGYLSQIAVLPALGMVAVAPNIILAMTVVFAMIYGPWTALAMGFFGGMMVDFMAGGALGISAFIPVVSGFLIGFFKREINSTHFAWAMIFAAALSIINDLWQLMTMYFARIDMALTWGALFRSFASAVETGIAAGITFLLITKLIVISEKRSGLPYLKRY
jgi:rod shape-determining protein MreD